MYHRWRDLLFLHWEWDPQDIQKRLPPGLTVDTYQSSAYLGVVPFYMQGIRPRYFPAVPGVSNFLELNLRTYVYDENGIPGVWFFSLDASQRLAVKLARKFFGLPYFHAKMTATKNRQGEVHFGSWRRGTGTQTASTFQYCGVGTSWKAEAGTLEFFLVERYVLFSFPSKTGRLLSGRVHHSPYPLYEAEVPKWDDRLFEIDGFSRPAREPDHILSSPGVDVEVFGVKPVSSPPVRA